LTTNPTLHGEHGHISVQTFSVAPIACSIPADGDKPTAPPPSLVADLHTSKALLRGMSDDSVRFWGNFGTESELFISAASPVRVVVRNVGGGLLAGPLHFEPTMTRTELEW